MEEKKYQKAVELYSTAYTVGEDIKSLAHPITEVKTGGRTIELTEPEQTSITKMLVKSRTARLNSLKEEFKKL